MVAVIHYRGEDLAFFSARLFCPRRLYIFVVRMLCISVDFTSVKRLQFLRLATHYKVGGGGNRGVTISRFPNPVLPPPEPFCPFVSRLPPFIVFLPLSCKSRCLTPYSDSIRSALALSKIKKLCCNSNTQTNVNSGPVTTATLPYFRGTYIITIYVVHTNP